ncbi:hypothetical protein GCM10009122_41000 [Fulvivirga kasyanovii]|uniref:ArsC family transcriptional regulator n=1 Tax=Fulvivirga kasyanovii TaxID=396812 RepID=A0ABW9RW85_9BACT|nr:ArsC/Spx/MgsR family protein [Fulvivirga kasyanovii]MTI27529.1 hypothetical protein [Fulvivirga kasyanovii]
MKAKENEILLIYNSEKQQDRKTKGYADTLNDHALNERDVLTDNLTETQIAEIARDMNIEIAELVDKNSDLYLQEYKNKSLSDDEITKVLAKNPEMIKTPIAYVGSEVFFVGSAYDFVNKDFDIEGVKSHKGNKFEK